MRIRKIEAFTERQNMSIQFPKVHGPTKTGKIPPGNSNKSAFNPFRINIRKHISNCLVQDEQRWVKRMLLQMN